MWLEAKQWFIENFSWIGFVAAAFIGSLVGHLKAYEAAAVEWPMRKHFWGYVIRSVYATFIALIVYWVYPYTGAPPPIAFIVTSILSVFGSETIDWMYKTLKKRMEKTAGVDNGDPK